MPARSVRSTAFVARLTALAAVALSFSTLDASASSVIEEVSSTEFDETVVRQSYDAPVVVEFYAEWCGYCARLQPVIQGLALEYRDRLRFRRVDVERDREIAERIGLHGVPTVVVFDRGMALSRISGPATPSKFRELFDSYLESE